MYEEYFRFSAPPFRLNPDPKFFFGSRSHNKAMAYLHYGLRQGEGFIVVTGEIGAGKSMLIGHLIDQLDRSNVVAAHLLTTNLEPSALLSHILSAFRIEPANKGHSAELEAFEDFLYDQMNRGRRVLLVVDEAQNLPVKTIEELRMLSNMNYEGTPLFQVFLVGQPQFKALLSRADMEQFRQRVIASYHLDPLSDEETKDYVRHRLSVVGWTGDPALDATAFSAIYAATGGVPRKINKLCNRILLHCATEKAHAIDAAVVEAVAADLGQENLERAAKRAPAPLAARIDEEPAEAAVVLPFAAKKAPVMMPAPTPAATVSSVATEVQATAVEAHAAPAPAEDRKPMNDSKTPPAMPATMSVLDRLRARKSEAAAAPAPATLEDVAEAIAAAKVEPAAESAPPEAEEAALEIGEKGWRAPVVRSLNETRDELKSAHVSVEKIRRNLADFDRRRREKHQRIAANLARAETLLAEIRNAWR